MRLHGGGVESEMDRRMIKAPSLEGASPATHLMRALITVKENVPVALKKDDLVTIPESAACPGDAGSDNNVRCKNGMNKHPLLLLQQCVGENQNNR